MGQYPKGPSMVMVKTTRGNTFGMYSPHSLTNFNFDRVGTFQRTGQSYFHSTVRRCKLNR